jgi:hypothetical protein
MRNKQNAGKIRGTFKNKKEVKNGFLSCLVPLTFESCNQLRNLLGLISQIINFYYPAIKELF